MIVMAAVMSNMHTHYGENGDEFRSKGWEKNQCSWRRHAYTMQTKL